MILQSAWDALFLSQYLPAQITASIAGHNDSATAHTGSPAGGGYRSITTHNRAADAHFDTSAPPPGMTGVPFNTMEVDQIFINHNDSDPWAHIINYAAGGGPTAHVGLTGYVVGGNTIEQRIGAGHVGKHQAAAEPATPL